MQESKWGGIFGQEEWKDLADGSPVPRDLSVKHFYPEGGKDSWVDLAMTIEGKLGDFELTYAGALATTCSRAPPRSGTTAPCPSVTTAVT